MLTIINMLSQNSLNIFSWELSDILSILLLFFLFIYGIYSIYLRISRVYNYPLWLDVLSLIIMFSILALELIQLKDWLRNYPLYYIFSFLGLFITVFALYSHNLVSVITFIALSVIHPSEESAPDLPRFGPAEMLERKKDYEGALMEYMVLARIYPHYSAVHIRIANVFEKLNRIEEGMDWLKKATKYLNKDNELHSVVTRYCDFAEKLGKKQQAIQMIDVFLSEYPDSEYAETLKNRKKQLLTKQETPHLADKLISLETEPLTDNETTPQSPSKKTTLSIEKIEIDIEKTESFTEREKNYAQTLHNDNVATEVDTQHSNSNLKTEKNDTTPPLEPL